MHDRFLKYIFCFLFILVFNSIFFSQSGDIAFRHLSVNDGLSANVINTVLEDDKGFIWIGTSFGLNKYDGVQFKSFHRSLKNYKSLLDDGITDLIQDKYNTIWIASSGGLCYINTNQGDIVHRLTHCGTKQILFNENRFYIDKESKLWMLSNNKVTCFKIEGIGKLHIIKEIALPAQLYFQLNFITEDKQGRILVATDFGIYRIRADNSVETITLDKDIYKSNEDIVKIKCCYVQNDSIIWFGASRYSGLIEYNTNNNKARNFKFNNQGNSVNEKFANMIRMIIPDKINGLLWIASRDKGLLSFNTVTKQFSSYEKDEMNPFSISSNGTRTLMQDSNGKLWVGSDEGVNILAKENQLFKSHYLPFISNNPQERTINFVLPDKNFSKNNLLWLGTNGKGLLLYDMSKKEFLPISFKSGKIKSILSTAALRNAEYDIKNPDIIWLVTNVGAYKLDINTRTITEGSSSGNLIENYHQMFFFNDQTIIFTSVKNSLILFNRNDESTKSIDLNKMAYNNKSLFVKVNEQSFWLFSNGKEVSEINIINENRTTFELEDSGDTIFDISINDIIKIDTTHYFLATTDGLWELNTKQKSCKKLFLGDDPRANYLAKGIKDSNGNIWLSNKAGIVFFNPKNNKVHFFGKNFNLVTSSILSRLKCDVRGTIYYGQDGMFYYFDPTNFITKTNTSTIRITSFIANDKNIPLNYKNKQISLINLAANENNVRVEFSMLNFEANNSNTYYYQLKGLSDKWIDCEHHTNAIFTNLKEGNYTLYIKAKDASGDFSTQIAELNFYIMPPFYKTWWFYMLEVLVVILIIYSIYKIRITRLLAVERLRTKIATDLHDDVGSTLSSISIISDLTKTKLDKGNDEIRELLQIISNNSKESVESMSDIIWSIKPTNDSIEQIIDRLKQFSSSVFDAKSIDFNFRYTNEVKLLKLNMEKRKTLYLILKEAINNIAKHSEASEASIVLEIINKSMNIVIADNGKGIHVSSIPGNGLNNMKQRIDQLNGTFSITSNASLGTKIEFSIPIG